MDNKKNDKNFEETVRIVQQEIEEDCCSVCELSDREGLDQCAHKCHKASNN